MDVETVLKKSDTLSTTRSREDRLHQLPPDPVPLYGRIDDDWTDRSDGVALAEKIKADNLAIASFGYYSENRGVPDKITDALRGDLH
jgi:hypothetical protein